MRRLPPLTAVEAFVQVARLGSVKAAAEELALSSPALSRRVQAMERFVGRNLFERRHQAMLLNTDGEILLARLAPALESLAEAIEMTTGEAELLRLRLAVLPLFASQRLMQRLPELRTRHPELHIDIDTGAHGLSRLGEGVDAAIVLARDVDPGLYSRRLDRNKVVAIGAQRMQEGRSAIRAPDDLRRMTIFLHRDMPETYNSWREAIGRPDLEPAAVDHFDSGHLMLDAAAQGLGVAFMLDSHLHDAHDPRLVEIFGDVVVDSQYSYWFACRRSALSRRPVRIFHDWLFEAIARD
ncbi:MULTISPECIES: LysR substrate-binding domain-containing protein [Sphingomonadales]|uniref:Glycine cleavage system transcriptional activator n=1 Tax=Edaphosphingomonas haloaromaticamans TaxID=653954 RepID=A0A1S1HAH1_9SPHN|nr:MULTISPECIES: LysR substrate-binding domain-containing protein [Sphingomonas]MDX3886348.1 LysR substrate-binding domain-containing protein [Sphingomonas sp.]OHT19095.1 Glycine cleavage system transcriptional activator [Sphingomonas haloaromaticamans]